MASGGAILFDYSCRREIRQQHRNRRNRCRRLCREIAALPSGRWCSSTRRAAGAAAEGKPRFAPLPERNRNSTPRAGSQARDPHRELCRDAASSASTMISRRWSTSITTRTIPISAGSSVPFPPISPRWKPMRCWQARWRGRSAWALPETFSGHRRRRWWIRIRNSWISPMHFG